MAPSASWQGMVFHKYALHITGLRTWKWVEMRTRTERSSSICRGASNLSAWKPVTAVAMQGLVRCRRILKPATPPAKRDWKGHVSMCIQAGLPRLLFEAGLWVQSPACCDEKCRCVMRGLLHSAADTKGEVSPSRRIGLAIDGVPEPLQSAMLIPLFENSHHCQLLTTQGLPKPANLMQDR